MNRTLWLRIATLSLVAIGMVLVWMSWQQRAAQDHGARALVTPPPSDSTIGRAFQQDGHGEHGDHAGGTTFPAMGTPPGGNVYAQAGEWWDQDGQALTLAALAGRPTVFTFIYTTCEDACPLIVQSMQAGLAKVPAELRERAQLVLISFDPKKDTPPVLKAYREKMELRESNWRLLTAPEDTVQAITAMAGFRYSPVGSEFSHNAVVAVANAQGEMVGWFADERITDAELLGKGLTQALGM